MLTVWPQLAAVKVRPYDPIPTTPTIDVSHVKAARGEGVALQMVLISDTAMAGVSPRLSRKQSAVGSQSQSDCQ
jgi:hypothetical protein